MKVWLDDWREEPEGWVRIKTAEETIGLLEHNEVSEMSLDYYLGAFETTGLKVLFWLRDEIEAGRLIHLPKIHIHSTHPYGSEEMKELVRELNKRTGENK